MAKEEDLKKIELKVSVNCCDGCKKKVLKALSVKGVLKTEIHPTLPKVTVTGNVDPKTLLKKLAKCGKMAEIISTSADQTKKQETAGGDKKTESARNEACGGKDQKPKEDNCEKKSGCEQDKAKNNNQAAEATGNKDGEKGGKDSKPKEGGCGGGNPVTGEVVKAANSNAVTAAAATALLPQMSCFINPSITQEAALPQPSHGRVYYPMDPYMVPMTYYMPGSYPATMAAAAAAVPSLPPPPCCMREHSCYHEAAMMYRPPPVQPLPPRLTEYFNDENTVGCHVM